jgi:protein disulfide-isomerase A6
VKGFPTIKFFGDDKSKPIDYGGGRDADSIRKFSLDQIVSTVNGRTKNAKKEKSAGSSSAGSENTNSSRSDKDVITLTDKTFDSTVFNSKDIWLVEFYAPWCGHCKALEPEWNEAASKLKGKVKLAKVDATVETQLASRFEVKGYPTIFYWNYGDGKSNSNKQTYNGPREAAGITAFANDLLNKADI